MGYQVDKIDPSKTVMIVVDMQNDFVAEGAKLRSAQAAAMVPKLAATLKFCRDKGIRVIYTAHVHRRDGSDMGLYDDLYEPIAEDKGVAFVVTAEENVVVNGDRDLLLEAVANLVDNAVKFTPEGGRVAPTLSRRGEDAVVSVRDTGPGIAADEREQVGRRFYRSDKSRSDPGFGLGLSLVNAIVKLHGFRFSVSGGPGCVAEIAGERASA